MSQTLVIFSPESYSVSMTYDNMGGIVQKNQTASLNYPGYPGEKYNYYYTQGNTAHPHATSKVWDRRNHKQYTYGFDHNGNPTTTHEQYAPPLQGQPNPSGPIDLIQQNYWDEQNQLRGLWNLSGLHHYIYDADGQRLMKSSVPMSYSSVNAQQLQATNSIAAQDYTVYVSAGLVYQSNGRSMTYTKHYYAGPLRVASQIGSANPNYETHPVSGGNIALGGPTGSTAQTNGQAVLSDLNTLLANYGMAVDANEPPQDTIAMQVVYHPTECDQFYAADLIERDRCLCDHFPDYALSKGIDCSPYTPIYWYHPDYIGNVEFVTDRTGQPYQHFYYAPFGDPMVSQHVGTGSFNSAYRFNAKEYDEETGNYYYGARYYQPKSSVWMGVDALATSYPGMNPYNFVMGNPIMAIDPDGNSTDSPEPPPGWLDYEWHDETGDYYNVGVFTGDDRDYVKVDPEGNTSHYRSYPALLSEAEVTAKSLMTDHQKTMNNPNVQAVHQSHRDFLSHEITQTVAFGMLDIATLGEFAAIRQGVKYLLKKGGKALVVREAAKGSKWVYGGFKSSTKWANQLAKRGWTEKQIGEAISKGKSFNAVNNVNKANGATRFVHPKTGQSIVIDNVTKSFFMLEGLDSNIRYEKDNIYTAFRRGYYCLSTCSSYRNG